MDTRTYWRVRKMLAGQPCGPMKSRAECQRIAAAAASPVFTITEDGEHRAKIEELHIEVAAGTAAGVVDRLQAAVLALYLLPEPGV